MSTIKDTVKVSTPKKGKPTKAERKRRLTEIEERKKQKKEEKKKTARENRERSLAEAEKERKALMGDEDFLERQYQEIVELKTALYHQHPPETDDYIGGQRAYKEKFWNTMDRDKRKFTMVYTGPPGSSPFADNDTPFAKYLLNNSERLEMKRTISSSVGKFSEKSHVDERATNEYTRRFSQLVLLGNFEVPMKMDRDQHKSIYSKVIEEIHRKVPMIAEIEPTIFAGIFGHVDFRSTINYGNDRNEYQYQRCIKSTNFKTNKKQHRGKRNYVRNCIDIRLFEVFEGNEYDGYGVWMPTVLWEFEEITSAWKCFDRRNIRARFYDRLRERERKHHLLPVVYWKWKRKKKQKRGFWNYFTSSGMQENAKILKTKLDICINRIANLGVFAQIMNKKESFFLFVFVDD